MRYCISKSMKLPSRNIVYLSITILAILITIWYFSRIYEGYDNLDEPKKNSCDNPEPEDEDDSSGGVSYDNLSAEEIKKQSKNAMKAENERLARPPKTSCNIITKPLLITLKNNDADIDEIPPYTLPEMKVSKMATTPAFKNIAIDYTKTLIKNKILNDSGKEIYMLDVDPNSKGIRKSTYNISSLSINYPDKELNMSEFSEYVTNSSLYDIYNKKKTKVKELSPTISVSSNKLYSRGIENRSLDIQLDSGRLNNNFIIITPTNGSFPSNFEIKLTNETEKTGIVLDLWGDSEFNKKKTQPKGNPNTILDQETLDAYLNKSGETDTFGYSKQTFGDTCSSAEEDTCMVGGLNIGKRAINIIQSGNIYDNNDNIIGSISKQESTQDNMNEIYTIQVTKSENITGIVLFISYPE